MKKKILQLALAELLVLAAFLGVFSGQPTAQAADFANPAFQKLWNRTDGPVATGRLPIWGSAPLGTRTERYDNSPAGQRLVQYFDKGRMEITQPTGDPTNLWYVTSGLLVRDLIGGIVQVGDNLALAFDSATIPVVGDEKNPLPTTPTYADFAEFAFSPALSRSRVGQPITRTLNKGGVTGTRSASAQPQVTIGYYDTTGHHNIAAPFWDFMNSTGPITAPNGQNVTGPLFEWQYLLGYPLTEAYWTTAKFDGQNQEVLIQLFERRALILNPAAPTNHQVDFTNVGRHWFEWQYGPATVSAGPTDVPASVNATITPTYGDVRTIFRLNAPGYKAGETIGLRLTQPDGEVYTDADFAQALRADKAGQVKVSFYGGDLATEANNGLGLYKLELTGKQSGQASTIFWRITEKMPLTPATPYDHDTTPAPPGRNAGIDPGSGPRGSVFNAFVDGFYLKDIFQDRLAAWATAPDGSVTGVNLATTDLILDAQETLQGMLLAIAAPPEPGLWALTIADKADPSRLAIIYIKVTAAPPELTIGAALRIYTAGTPDAKPVGLDWHGPFHLTRQPKPTQPQGGDDDN